MFTLLIIVVFILSFVAQIRVSSVYKRNAAIPSRGGISGREAAEAVMTQAGISDVSIQEIGGHLTDHFDPVHKTLNLSSENYRGTSLAALGVSAHEAGHAIQQHVGYRMMYARMALVPATNFVSRLIPIIVVASWFLVRGLSGVVLDVAIVCYAVLTLFNLVTLPVEYDASRRAKAQLVNLGIVGRDEIGGVNETLDAAALTYLATFVLSLLFLLELLSSRRR